MNDQDLIWVGRSLERTADALEQIVHSLAPPPAPKPPAEVDDVRLEMWECRSCLAWNGVEDEFCLSCGRGPTDRPAGMPGMKRYKVDAPEPPAEVDLWELLREAHGLLFGFLGTSTLKAWQEKAEAALAAHDEEKRP